MGLIVDSFAGGGGASTGIEAALGRPIDIAINHDPEALALHRANHPGAQHIIEDIWGVDPLEACHGEPVDIMWCSPDCTHFSKAKGSKPRDKRIRGLAWIAVRWARRVRPKVIFLENVEEFRTWGPVDRKGHPVKRLAGRTFWRFVRALQKLGYAVEWKELRACDYGAPTTRNRFYLVARCDGLPIIWPTPTHGTASTPVRTAAECIDWSIPCPSIFERKKPLADATCRRIAKGIVRYVLNNPKPFIVQYHGDTTFRGQSNDEPIMTIDSSPRYALVTPYITEHANASSPRSMPADEPLRTVCASVKGGHFALVAPHVTKFRTGSVGSGMDEPLPTVTSGGACERPAGAAHAMGLVTAFIAKHYTGVVGSDLGEPLPTITAKDHNAVVASHIVKMRGTNVGQKTDEPLQTITGQGLHFGEVRAFLVKYYGQGIGQDVAEPLGTVTSKDRFGVVTVNIEGETYAISDIGMRMLRPRELFRAQGFPDSYVIDPIYNGRRLPGTAQVRMCGNSVCPPVAEALVRANAAEFYGEVAA